MKQAAEQMLKVAFPGAKDMSEAMSSMQNMMKQMGVDPSSFSGMASGLKSTQVSTKKTMGFGPKKLESPDQKAAQLDAAISMLRKKNN